jgi:hypothetical protein
MTREGSRLNISNPLHIHVTKPLPNLPSLTIPTPSSPHPQQSPSLHSSSSISIPVSPSLSSSPSTRSSLQIQRPPPTFSALTPHRDAHAREQEDSAGTTHSTSLLFLFLFFFFFPPADGPALARQASQEKVERMRTVIARVLERNIEYLVKIQENIENAASISELTQLASGAKLFYTVSNREKEEKEKEKEKE